MGLSHVGAGAAMNLDEDDDDDDDDSDMDDIKLLPDDSIIVIAKTEEVQLFVAVSVFLLFKDVFSLP
jgi:hypothetical protein